MSVKLLRTLTPRELMPATVSYCKRHLAQEGHLKETKTEEELEKTKSTKSLKVSLSFTRL